MIIRVAEGEHQGKNIFINIRYPGCGINYILELDEHRCMVGFGGKEYTVDWSMRRVLSAVREADVKLRTMKLSPA